MIAGDLAPGQRLTERELIDRVGVSRTVIREALRQLESEGLVETVPNKGPVVRALSRAEAVDLYRCPLYTSQTPPAPPRPRFPASS